MRKAFTLLELLFVMVIFGVLATIAVTSFKPHHLRSDADFILLKIMEARYQGLAYDKSGLSQPDGVGCIDLRPHSLQELAAKAHYRIKSAITNSFDLLCFDHYGRPHKDDNLTTKSSVITSTQTILQLRYKDKNASLILYPKSGYVIIRQQ